MYTGCKAGFAGNGVTCRAFAKYQWCDSGCSGHEGVPEIYGCEWWEFGGFCVYSWLLPFSKIGAWKCFREFFCVVSKCPAPWVRISNSEESSNKANLTAASWLPLHFSSDFTWGVAWRGCMICHFHTTLLCSMEGSSRCTCKLRAFSFVLWLVLSSRLFVSRWYLPLKRSCGA